MSLSIARGKENRRKKENWYAAYCIVRKKKINQKINAYLKERENPKRKRRGKRKGV